MLPSKSKDFVAKLAICVREQIPSSPNIQSHQLMATNYIPCAFVLLHQKDLWHKTYMIIT